MEYMEQMGVHRWILTVRVESNAGKHLRLILSHSERWGGGIIGGYTGSCSAWVTAIVPEILRCNHQWPTPARGDTVRKGREHLHWWILGECWRWRGPSPGRHAGGAEKLARECSAQREAPRFPSSWWRCLKQKQRGSSSIGSHRYSSSEHRQNMIGHFYKHLAQGQNFYVSNTLFSDSHKTNDISISPDSTFCIFNTIAAVLSSIYSAPKSEATMSWLLPGGW